MKKSKADIVGDAYSKDHWSTCPDVYRDLVLKDRDRTHPVPDNQSNRIFRAVLTFDHFRENLAKGSRIIDMGCGMGFNTCFLLKEGYEVRGFDRSDVGIERSRQLADSLDLDPGVFSCADHTYLRGVPDASVDAVIGMGFIYYLDDEARDEAYRNIVRVLKPGALAVLTLTNHLFDAFALNDTSLKFWADLMEGASPAASLLSGGNALELLKKRITVPERKKSKTSISRRFQIHADNPLTYCKFALGYGLDVEEILYPDCHLLPPFLEAETDPGELEKIKALTCVQMASDWRGLFMDYEFLAFMKKTAG